MALDLAPVRFPWALLQVFAWALTLTITVTVTEAGSPLQTTRARDRGFPVPESIVSLGAGTPKAKAKYWPTAGATGRLPPSIVPSHYELTIIPVLDRSDPLLGDAFGTALGDITITVQCTGDSDEPVSSVTLHAFRNLVNISHESVTIVDARTDGQIPVIDFVYVDEFHFFTIQLGQSLFPGNEYRISMRFNTTISTDRYNGLYMTQYLTPGEMQPSLIAVTTFAPSSARQAFPCFDEPALKATFNITIARKDPFIALSNNYRISSEEREPGSGWFYDTFAETVKMSTYLAIIFVADYQYRQADLPLPDGKPVRIYAPPYMVDGGGADYAAGVAQKVMAYFEEYLGVDYKLEKYDSAAIPDFMYNAMENYGLVTYRTPSLIYFNGETTETQRKQISRVMAHESAHHWFGNLITMQWWNQVWLKEGFASYYAPFGMEETDPEFEPHQAFLNDVLQFSMPFDSDPAYTHPMLSPDSIMAPLYDRINYEKAACIVRMMEGFLTEATLKAGLRRFLRDSSFQAVEQNDLFLVLTDQAHTDGTLAPDLTVKDIMDTWTQQAGFPLVRVTASGSSYVFVSQERFVSLPTDPRDQHRDLDPNDLWTIPISIATTSDPDFSEHVPKFWLMKDKQLLLHPHNTSEWIMLNTEATGYYRILYDTGLTNRIISQLVTDLDVISPLSRSQLIDDYFKSALLAHVNIETAFELTKYLVAERDPHVWDTVLTNLESIYSLFMTSNEGLALLSEYLVPKLEAVIMELGLDQVPTDKGNKVLHRLQLLDWACGMDSTLCVDRAVELFVGWQADPENATRAIPLDLQPVIFCTAVAKDQDDQQGVVDFVLDRYGRQTTPPFQKTYLLNALACSKNLERIARFLEEIANPASNMFPISDARALLQKLFANPAIRLHAFDFVRVPAHLDALISKFGLSIIGDAVTMLAMLATTSEELANIEDFINENTDKFDGIKPVLDRAMAKIQENVAWMSSFGTRVINWLQAQAKTPEQTSTTRR